MDIGIIAAIISLIAVFVSLLARKDSRKANELSEQANKLAERVFAHQKEMDERMTAREKQDRCNALRQKRRGLRSLAFENKTGLEALYHILTRRREYYKSMATNESEFAKRQKEIDFLDMLNRRHLTFMKGTIDGLDDENRIMDESFMDNLKTELIKVKTFINEEKQTMNDDEKLFAVKIAEKYKANPPK